MKTLKHILLIWLFLFMANSYALELSKVYKSGLDKVMQRYNSDQAIWLDPVCVESGSCIAPKGVWYWANAAYLMIDYQRLTGDKPFYAKELADILQRNSNLVYGKDFFDDEGWWVLTYIAAYENSGNKTYLSNAEHLSADMHHRGAQHVCGGGSGGIYWDAGRTQVGSIANELYITINAKLYLLTHKMKYKHRAEDGWRWFVHSGLLSPDGTIADHYMIKAGKCGDRVNWHYSYNNGVILSGLVSLYKINHDQKLLSTAKTIAKRGLDIFTKNGVLTETCNNPYLCADDAFLFKGIFAYNLAYFALNANDNQFKDQIKKYLADNYQQVVLHQGELGNFAFIWSLPINHDKGSAEYNPYDIVSQLSALYLIAANIMLNKN